jgi:hypothetical protein
MKPFLTKGYAKRKLYTGNQSVQFDEEGEVERPLLYSTHRRSSAFICVHLRLIFVSLSDRLRKSKFGLFSIKPQIESANNNQAHPCLNLLENKPQINADERRFVNLNIQRLNCLSLSERGEP